MISDYQQAIEHLIKWRTPYFDSNDPVEINSVVQAAGNMIPAYCQPFQCSLNAQFVRCSDPERYSIVSGWTVAHDPQCDALGVDHYIIISHYWNYDHKTQRSIDFTPVAPWLQSIESTYVADPSIYLYARFLHYKLELDDVSLVAPSFALNAQTHEMIELEEIQPGLSRFSDLVLGQGSLGNIFHRVCFVNDRWHPKLKAFMES